MAHWYHPESFLNTRAAAPASKIRTSGSGTQTSESESVRCSSAQLEIAQKALFQAGLFAYMAHQTLQLILEIDVNFPHLF